MCKGAGPVKQISDILEKNFPINLGKVKNGYLLYKTHVSAATHQYDLIHSIELNSLFHNHIPDSNAP